MAARSPSRRLLLLHGGFFSFTSTHAPISFTFFAYAPTSFTFFVNLLQHFLPSTRNTTKKTKGIRKPNSHSFPSCLLVTSMVAKESTR